MNIDTRIDATWIVPVEPERQVLKDYSVVLRGGRIVELLPTSEAIRKYRPEQVHSLSGHVLIPGLINAHTHTAMSLLRGLADDMPLMTWLERYIWPAERRWVGEEFVHDGSVLAIAEMLLGGVTAFNDMYFFPDVTARAAAAAGIRASVGLIAVDFPSAWAESADEYLARGIEVHDQFRSHPLIRTAFAPHAPYSVSDAPLERIRVLADELDIPVHMHVHETADEVADGQKRFGMRPLERLSRLGLVTPSLVAVHLTQVTDDEIGQLAVSGTHVIHCPESNLKLASGFCPVSRLLASGVNLALGTDGAASNNDLDMFGEMRTAALLAKGVAQDASAVDAFSVLRMATLNAAKALQMSEDTGSLAPGKAADIVAVDLSGAETAPVYDPVSQLVYCAGRDKVRHVWVAGRHLVAAGELLTLDLQDILERSQVWRDRLSSAADGPA